MGPMYPSSTRQKTILGHVYHVIEEIDLRVKPEKLVKIGTRDGKTNVKLS